MSFDDAVTRLRDVGDESSMAALAQGADEARVEDLARLTDVLARSGDILGPVSAQVVDVASTGGPGSLSTLLAPLFVRGLGGTIAKIAVPGRPAGGLDSLASLPGYRSEMDANTARTALESCGYVHVGAGRTFCPLDATFFAWRQASGAQSIPSLAIASLLAKKYAAGAGRVVLDVRVGDHGNFGKTVGEARANSRRLIAVAKELGIDATCTLSATPAPVQPWVGRGEALLAVAEVLTANDVGALTAHAAECKLMAALALGREVEVLDPPGLLDAAREVHDEMLEAHGASASTYWSRVAEVRACARTSVQARATGSVSFEVSEIRNALVLRQSQATPLPGASFSDPSGVRFAVEAGSVVQQGDVLAGVRDVDDPEALCLVLERHFVVAEGQDASLEQSTDLEVVRG